MTNRTAWAGLWMAAALAGCAAAGPDSDPDLSDRSQALHLELPYALATGETCTPDLQQCGRDGYCASGLGACDAASGTCQERPESCPTLVSMVCGCDGETYRNRCAAALAGVSVEHLGPCHAVPDPPEEPYYCYGKSAPGSTCELHLLPKSECDALWPCWGGVEGTIVSQP